MDNEGVELVQFMGKDNVPFHTGKRSAARGAAGAQRRAVPGETLNPNLEGACQGGPYRGRRARAAWEALNP